MTLSLVRAQDALLRGSIPLGVLREMQALAEKTEPNGDVPKEDPGIPEVSQAVIDSGQKFRKEMVRRTIRRVAPSVAELDGPDDEDVPEWVVDKFDQEDFDALAAYALRETPLPASTST